MKLINFQHFLSLFLAFFIVGSVSTLSEKAAENKQESYSEKIKNYSELVGILIGLGTLVYKVGISEANLKNKLNNLNDKLFNLDSQITNAINKNTTQFTLEIKQEIDIVHDKLADRINQNETNVNLFIGELRHQKQLSDTELNAFKEITEMKLKQLEIDIKSCNVCLNRKMS
jgi:hypothetical protein